MLLLAKSAAGIDIGSGSHFVAVPPDRDEDPVREFRSFTANLERLADWLGECGIDTVAIVHRRVLDPSVRTARRARLDSGTGRRGDRDSHNA